MWKVYPMGGLCLWLNGGTERTLTGKGNRPRTPCQVALSLPTLILSGGYSMGSSQSKYRISKKKIQPLRTEQPSIEQKQHIVG
ncbi:MAG: hypothetical protein PUP93_28420 [Rhizonema sp. NSF051]|nr:hypothetical protein [Rhizonema sp. NSF051]